MIGDKDIIKSNRQELEAAPLMCGDIVTKEKAEYKYLGDMIAGSLALSVTSTIKDRESKVRGAMLEAKVLVEDFRAQAMGGILSGLDLWEAAILPTLLYMGED